MQLNEAGLDLIKAFEGLRLKAYQDIAGIWTIGYGHIKDVHEGQVITEHEAEIMLTDELKDYEWGVSKLLKVPVTSNQFSALVAFAYNVGLHALENSTLLKKLNAGDATSAADHFLDWDKARVNGVLREVLGLKRRREAERKLFLKPD